MARLRCAAKIYVRDQLRYTGRTPSGFEMHFNEEQCARAAKTEDLCWQHLRYGQHVTRCPWAEKYMEEKTALAGSEP